jgi:hypothetical protein
MEDRPSGRAWRSAWQRRGVGHCHSEMSCKFKCRYVHVEATSQQTISEVNTTGDLRPDHLRPKALRTPFGYVRLHGTVRSQALCLPVVLTGWLDVQWHARHV